MGSYRLHAPTEDGGAVARPSLDEAVGQAIANQERLDGWEHDFQGRSSHRLRREARDQLARLSKQFHTRLGLDTAEAIDLDAPLVVTGHQPELFHPGVWAKNFAAAWIARQVGGGVLSLIVDNDIPRGAHVRVPTLRDGELATTLIDFDLKIEDVPYEEWSIHEEGLFASFAERLRAALHPAVTDPLIDDFWPLALKAAATTDHAGLRFVAARHGLEAGWGVVNAELPLSLACETEAFLWFVSHILAHLPRFQSIHNASLDAYRRQFKIRSRHHPVADLHAEGPWLEAPFWVWRQRGGTRRRALYARQGGRTVELRIDGEDDLLAQLPLAPDAEACCAAERLRELPASGVRLRPRALTTTMFARLLVGDLFVHGIGGAKYDELGDEIIRRFFGVEPPPFLAFSMTVWPGLPVDPVAPGRRRELVRAERDLEYNPERSLAPPWSEHVHRAIMRKRTAIEGATTTRRERIDRFQAIRNANALLRDEVAPRIEVVRRERDRVEEALERNRVAQGRDFAFVAHSRSRVRDFYRARFPGLLSD